MPRSFTADQMKAHLFSLRVFLESHYSSSTSSADGVVLFLHKQLFNSCYLIAGPCDCRTQWLGSSSWSVVSGPMCVTVRHRFDLVPLFVGNHPQELQFVLGECVCRLHFNGQFIPSVYAPQGTGEATYGRGGTETGVTGEERKYKLCCNNCDNCE